MVCQSGLAADGGYPILLIYWNVVLKQSCFTTQQLNILFPEVQEGVKLSLEGAQATFISYDRLVISLKGGELYVLTLYADSMRSIRSFHFEKAAASVLTTCVRIAG